MFAESAPAAMNFEHGLNPLTRARWLGRLARGARSFGIAVGIVTLAALAIGGALERQARIATPPVAPPKADWVEFSKPVQVYALQSPEFGKDVRAYEARRHREGGGRQDMLAYGAAEIGQGNSLRISIYRPGAELAPEMPFFVDIARQAGRAGLAVKRSAVPDAMATRFGSFEVADLVLVQGETEASCLGFRLNAGEPELRIAGFACGGAKVLERPTLACALDRLELLAGGDDKALTKFFIAAEQTRNKACAAQRALGARQSWLDQGGKAPALRASATPASGKGR
jgi:hypothetical protein